MPPARSIALASTLAVDSASEPASASSDTSTARAAPMASAVRRPDTSPLGAIEIEHDLAAAGLVGQLQRHLDAVGVGVVEDELARPLERVVRLELARHRRVRDLLHADCDVHSVSPRAGPGAPTNRSRRLMT